MTPTAREVSAVVKTVAALGQVIRELGSVPSGHLYAHVMGTLSLDSYERCIDKLVELRYVRRNGHVLEWVGEPM